MAAVGRKPLQALLLVRAALTVCLVAAIVVASCGRRDPSRSAEEWRRSSAWRAHRAPTRRVG